MTIAQMNAAADAIAYGNIGYDQSQRWSFYQGGQIVQGGEGDCSSTDGAIIKMGGYPIDLSGTFFTGNITQRARAAGFSVFPFTSLDDVRPGDSLVTPGHHVVYVRDYERMLSAENDERGRSSGGQAGNQTGREIRYRPWYVRPGGWTYILRPPADEIGAAGPAPSRPAPDLNPLPGDPRIRLVVDHDLGPKTVSRIEQWSGCPLSGRRTLSTAAWASVQATINALDPNPPLLEVDGQAGPKTIAALQVLVGASLTGRLDAQTVAAWQTYLNTH